MKVAIAQAFWAVNLEQRRDSGSAFADELDSYFAYFLRQSDIFLRDDGLHVSVQTYQDILNIAEVLLRENLGRSEAISSLHKRSRMNEARCEASISLTSRLIFMMSIGTAPYIVPGGIDLTWNDGSGSIRDFIASFIDHHLVSMQRRCDAGIKLDKLFTAQNMDRIAGLKITWTDDISDHLRLFNSDTEVAIFHNASFLRISKHSYVQPP